MNPVVRVRMDGDRYYLTYKGSGKMAREEYNLPLSEAAYRHLLKKKDGRVIRKTRYRIPLSPYTVELDLFHGEFEGLLLAEVEFPTVEAAKTWTPGSAGLSEYLNDEVTGLPGQSMGAYWMMTRASRQ